MQCIRSPRHNYVHPHIASRRKPTPHPRPMHIPAHQPHRTAFQNNYSENLPATTSAPRHSPLTSNPVLLHFTFAMPSSSTHSLDSTSTRHRRVCSSSRTTPSRRNHVRCQNGSRTDRSGRILTEIAVQGAPQSPEG